MSLPAQKFRYPYITSDPKIAHGAPIIEGTRITVRTIAAYYQMETNGGQTSKRRGLSA